MEAPRKSNLIVPTYLDEAVEVGARGFAAVPRALLRYRLALGLDSLDLVLLTALISHIDAREGHRRVAKARQPRLVEETGIADRALRRHLAKLETLGFIEVSRMANHVSEYSLAGLWARLDAIVYANREPKPAVQPAAVTPVMSRGPEPKREDFDSDEAFNDAFIAYYCHAA